ncbi:hypothetical protein TrLO_g5915 [Triparma laevis f. longispina]|uniref:F-box domain-containing protein n=1 Tax=Triparma laevis f. longispina TaxID=1714387 RepID=A0A9W7C420_9STRA|nr:hypothetical protein TrLO_g5915 [Triparma laevis f. longispina]
MKIHRIPEEVLRFIFTLLNPNDVARSSYVCVFWRTTSSAILDRLRSRSYFGFLSNPLAFISSGNYIPIGIRVRIHPSNECGAVAKRWDCIHEHPEFSTAEENVPSEEYSSLGLHPSQGIGHRTPSNLPEIEARHEVIVLDDGVAVVVHHSNIAILNKELSYLKRLGRFVRQDDRYHVDLVACRVLATALLYGICGLQLDNYQACRLISFAADAGDEWCIR